MYQAKLAGTLREIHVRDYNMGARGSQPTREVSDPCTVNPFIRTESVSCEFIVTETGDALRREGA